MISFKGRGVQSSVALAALGCFVVTLATTAGLGFSTIVGIKFNAATTQVYLQTVDVHGAMLFFQINWIGYLANLF